MTTTAEKTMQRILVVDDDPKIVKQISSSLDDAGYHTIGTTSGKEALKLAGQYKPYAITLDIVMPDMDGEEAFHRLRQLQPDLRVILMSGYDEENALGRLAGERGVAFIHKPFVYDTLIAKLHEVMRA